MKSGKGPAQRQPGQRAISSFLFKQSSGDGNKPIRAARAEPQPDVPAPCEAEPSLEPAGPPAKRARFFPPPAEDAATAPAPQGPGHGCELEPRADQNHHAPPPNRPRRPDNHQRFQNKLVLGIGNRKQQDRSSIVPQKHTPLELQVVELKENNPGVLLAIEVGYKFRFFGDDAEVASKVGK